MSEEGDSLECTLVLRALHARQFKLTELAVAIGGMYPADLKALLDQLQAKGLVVREDDIYRLAISQIPLALTGKPPSIQLLPPHPANMDWRYEGETARFLAERSLAASKGNGLFIGSPSAFVHWHQLAPARPARVLDASARMVAFINAQTGNSHHQAQLFDMCRPLDWNDAEQFDVCLCDPPWYEEHYFGALGIASIALSLGAQMLVSILPPLARPGGYEDRRKIFAMAEQLGFHLLSLEHNVLRYITPEFERRSLANAGIDIPTVWRCGDLATFVKVREVAGDVRSTLLAAFHGKTIAERDYEEIFVNGQLWRLRGPFDDVGTTPELIGIEPNDILSTVSRRYAGRAKIDLWLSDNRVFGMRGRAAIRRALMQIQDGTGSLSSEAEDATIAEAHRLLKPLLANYDKKASPEGQIL